MCDRVRTIQDYWRAALGRHDRRCARVSVSLREIHVARVFAQRGARGQAHDQAITRVISARFHELDGQAELLRVPARELLSRGFERVLDGSRQRLIDVTVSNARTRDGERQVSARRIHCHSQWPRVIRFDSRLRGQHRDHARRTTTGDERGNREHPTKHARC